MPYSSLETITQQAVARWSTTHDPRLRELITKLIPHVHAYAKEVGLTHEEWINGLNFLARVGQAHRQDDGAGRGLRTCLCHAGCTRDEREHTEQPRESFHCMLPSGPGDQE